MSTHTQARIGAMIEAIHPEFISLRIAAKDIENELDFDSRRPISVMLEALRVQLEGAHRAKRPEQPMTPSPKG